MKIVSICLSVLVFFMVSCSVAPEGVSQGLTQDNGSLSQDYVIKLPKPDLVVTYLSPTVLDSTHIQYTYTVKNQGTAAIQQKFVSVQAMISADTVWGGDSGAGGTVVGWNDYLNPGDSITKSFTCTLPAGVLHPETGQYLLMKVDPSSQVSELNENNNITAAVIPVIKPDLIITSAFAAYSSTHVEYTFTVQNIGNTDADLNWIGAQAFIRTGSPTTLSGQRAAGGFAMHAYTDDAILSPGESTSFYFGCTLSASWYDPNQHQYLILFADYGDNMAELSEANNSFAYQLH